MKKLLISLTLVMGCLSIFGGIFAEEAVLLTTTQNLSTIKTVKSDSNFMDLRAYEEIYKMSEDTDVGLPFIKAFNKRATYDKLISSSGLSVAAETIDIQSEMKGVQTIISGDTVNITGKLEYANIIAKNVIIDGEISKDVLINAQSIFITDKAKIGGDLICIAGAVDIKGTISGSVILNADSATISGLIGKDFRAKVRNLEISASTNIKREIYIETDSAINILDKYPSAVVKKYEEIKATKASVNIKEIIMSGLTAILSYTVLYYIIKKMNKNGITKYSNKIKEYPVFTILLGFASLFLIPIEMIIILILCAAGLGAVLGPILILYIALFIAVLFLSTFITGTIIFEMLSPKIIKKSDENNNSKWLEALLLLGIFTVLYVLTKWDITSGYIVSLAIIVSLGSIITNIFRKEKVAVEIKEEK